MQAQSTRCQHLVDSMLDIASGSDPDTTVQQSRTNVARVKLGEPYRTMSLHVVVLALEKKPGDNLGCNGSGKGVARLERTV